MKTKFKFIKGILLTTLLISIFSLNIQPILNNHITEGEIGQSRTEKQTTEFADYFTPKAFADDADNIDILDFENAEDETRDETPDEEDEGGEEVLGEEDEKAWNEEVASASETPESDTEADPKAETSKEPITVRIEKDPIDAKAIMQTVARASTYVNSLFNPLIHFFTFNIGNFLGNDYIFAGHMSDMLHNIWIVSRNIVNIIFVLILLFLAVRHIFGSEEGGNTDLKKTLPMFVIMLIAINFSWLGGKVILDAANVATNVVFQIPAGVERVAGEGLSNKLEKCAKDEEGKPSMGCMPSAFYYPAGATETIHYFDDCDKTVLDAGYANAHPPGDKNGNKASPYYQKISICWKQMDIGAYNQNNASYFLSFSMARVQNLTLASTDKDVSKVAIGVLFSLIIQIVYLAAFLALYLALIIRVAALWFLMAFSPFLVLMHYLTKDLNVPGSDKFSIKAFANWAFVPAAVGAVWSVGFIMITTGQTMTGNIFAKLNQSGEITSSVFSMKSLFMGMESWQQFIWLIMTIGIIWIGTFAALSKLPVVGAVVGKIDEYGKRAAKVVGSAPKWAPIMPLYDYKTGKMDWNKRVGLGALSPVAKLEGVQAEMLSKQRKGLGSTMQFEAARNKLKNISDLGTQLGRQTRPEAVFNRINELSGNKFTKDGIRNDQASFNRMIDSLENLNKAEKEHIKSNVTAHVGGTALPATVPAPGAGGDVASKTAAGAEKGVRDGLMAKKEKTPEEIEAARIAAQNKLVGEGIEQRVKADIDPDKLAKAAAKKDK